MNGPNDFILGPVCFVIAFLFYGTSKMLAVLENRLRGPDGNTNPVRERFSRILRLVFLGAAVCFCLAGVVLIYLGLKQ